MDDSHTISASTDIRQALMDRGVRIHAPESVDIAPSINPDQIANDVTIHAGCRLAGEDTWISEGTTLGAESPVTICNAQLGRNVSVAGGYVSGATLLDGVTVGDGAHFRPGTLLEEHASCGHTVGLKQTLLMPFVTAGSLINFCDCLMAGGTGPKNHSEIGSSYVHFNFTPHQDKATASLIGDVPRGVMLNQKPIFLGGQGGLVGPAAIEYGTIIAAGTVCRRDVAKPDLLVFGQTGHRIKEHSYDTTVYGEVDRILFNNFRYIGNLHALREWISIVRMRFVRADPFREACYEGALGKLNAVIEERVGRLAQLATKLAASLDVAATRSADALQKPPFARQKRFVDAWSDMEPRLTATDSGPANIDPLICEIDSQDTADYMTVIQSLSAPARDAGTGWLQSIVDRAISIYEDIREP